MFNAPLAELALAAFSLQYLGKAKILSPLASRSLLQAHRDAPTSGMSHWLPLVFGHAPPRVCGQARLAREELKVEFFVDAAYDWQSNLSVGRSSID